MSTEPRENWDEWPRRIYEALRPIDPRAEFWVEPLELDLRGARGYSLEGFPFDDLRSWMDGWLDLLDPDGPPDQREWVGHGVRLRFRARGRKHPDARGWHAKPTLTTLEQPISDLHLVDGGRRAFIGLTRGEVERLAAGELRLIGQGLSYRETFVSLAEAIRLYGAERVGDLHTSIIETFAGLLGLLEAPPSLGNFEQGWRDIHGLEPAD